MPFKCVQTYNQIYSEKQASIQKQLQDARYVNNTLV